VEAHLDVTAPHRAPVASIGAGATGLQAEHFDRRASTWSARYRSNPSFRARLAVVGGAVDGLLAGVPAARVLDYGGGTGIFSVLAAQRAEVVVCVDRSEAMLRCGATDDATTAALLAEAGFDRPPGKVLRVVGDSGWIPPSARPFDLILAIAVLEYVEDCAGLLGSLAGALRPAGRVLLTVPDPQSSLRRLQRRLTPATARRAGRRGRLADQSFVAVRPHGDNPPWREASEAAGLHVEQVRHVPLGGSGPLRRIRPNLLVTLRGRR